MKRRAEPDPELAQRVRDILAIIGPRDPDAGGRPLTRDDGTDGGLVGLWNS